MGKEKKKQSDQIIFSVREKRSDIKYLDMAIKLLGWKDRSDWYRAMKRETIAKAKLLPLMAKENALEESRELLKELNEQEED